jgi:hypothetical protein
VLRAHQCAPLFACGFSISQPEYQRLRFFVPFRLNSLQIQAFMDELAQRAGTEVGPFSSRIWRILTVDRQLIDGQITVSNG